MSRAAPSPETSSEDVVAVVLRALADADTAHCDDAVTVVHGFASDRMRSTLGGKDGLRRALGNTLYSHLLGHRDAVIESLDRHGEAVRAVVAVTAANGSEARFTLALARAGHGDRRGCWLLSGLAREGVDL